MRPLPAPKPDDTAPTIDLARLWPIAEAAAGDWNKLSLRLPQAAGAALQISYLSRDAAHDRAIDRLHRHAQTGAIELHARYAQASAGQQLTLSMFALHSGSYFGLAGRLIAMLAALLMPLFFITGWQMYLARRRLRRAQTAPGGIPKAAIDQGP